MSSGKQRGLMISLFNIQKSINATHHIGELKDKSLMITATAEEKTAKSNPFQ
jgi:hypothetical protein